MARIGWCFETVLCLDGGGAAMAMAREVSGGLAGEDKLAGETSRWYGAGRRVHFATEGDERGAVGGEVARS